MAKKKKKNKKIQLKTTKKPIASKSSSSSSTNSSKPSTSSLAAQAQAIQKSLNQSVASGQIKSSSASSGTKSIPELEKQLAQVTQQAQSVASKASGDTSGIQTEIARAQAMQAQTKAEGSKAFAGSTQEQQFLQENLTYAPTTPVTPEVLTPESIAEAVSGATPKQAEGYVPTEVEQPQEQVDTQENVIPVQGQQQGFISSQGGQVQQGNLSTPSVVDYLASIGQATDFNSRKTLAGQYGIQGYTGTAQQNTQLLGALRGAVVTPQEQVTPTSAGGVTQTTQQVSPQGGPAQSLATAAQKYGLTSTQDDFFNDPLKTISTITQQVFKSMGLDQANSAITDISEELEDLENDRDEEIQAINDDPWLTEGVRLRQIQKVEAKWADRIDSRVNKLGLLESVRDDAQQQAQFALGTAISIYDSERRFQADQIQQYYDQAQRDFDNMIKVQELGMKSTGGSGTSEMQEYLFSVEQGFNGSFLDYKQAIAAAGRAPSSDGGYDGPYTKAQLSAITKINESVSKNATYAKTASMRGYIDNVNAALSQANGLSDIAAINQFQKVIDEGAVTRDQDVVLIQGAQSLANQLNTKISSLQKGDQLGTGQRSQMKTLMQQIYNAQVNALGKDPYIGAKKKEAGLYGLTETDTILGELGGFDNDYDATTALDNIVNSSPYVYTPTNSTKSVDSGGGFWNSFTKVFGF